MSKEIEVFDTVVVNGRKGTVVFIHKNDNADCEVEFYAGEGCRFAKFPLNEVLLNRKEK